MDTHRITTHRALFSSLTFCCLLASAMIATAKKPPLKPININVATSEELQQVPGIGPVTADKILQMRKSYGAFKSVDDLLAIRGIGKKRLDKMRKYLTVGKIVPKSTTPQKSVAAKSSSVSKPSANTEHASPNKQP